MANTNLTIAKEAKNDDFYTQLSDIQVEMNNYLDKFKNKIVFCNCDDPFESNFVKYFLMNFNRLGLKELIATGYKTSSIGGNEIGTPNTPYVLRVKETKKYLVGTQKDLDNNGAKYFLETENNNIMFPLIGNYAIDTNGEKIKTSIKEEILDSNGNSILNKKGKPKTKNIKKDLYYEAGDFRSDMSLALLKECDIVVTNPPFSLFREYIATLIKYKKQFLVIGNLNAITYKEIFPLLKNNQIWIGNKSFSGGMDMIYPKDKKAQYERQRGVCPHCKKRYEYVAMVGDHIVPYNPIPKSGQINGTTTPDNLQMLCNSCNLDKSNKPFDKELEEKRLQEIYTMSNEEINNLPKGAIN